MSNLPQRVGNYQLERQIGKGGMSEVWVARHRSLEDRLVAVKLLLSQDPEWIDRFTREANITSRLRHEHIIQIYDHGYQHPYHYTIMEFVSGGALRELLRSHRQLPLDLALHVFRCAGAALDYAHAHGVIHRDVSPGNILLEQSSRRVVLTDFGIARESGKTGTTTITKVMGTPGYLSPEHASSATAVTHLSDIYGLGVVLFEMLSGVLPWDHNPGMAPENGGGPFMPPPTLRSRGVEGLPPDVDRVIQTMLMIDPAKRYPTAQAAIDDLDQVLARHTGPTQVVSGAGGAAAPRAQALDSIPPAEQHPVEKVLGPDLLKGPMQDARRRADQLRAQPEITALLDRWSAEGRWRRRLLGRQALLHRVVSTNVYFYTLKVLYETRAPAKLSEEPDYKTLAVKLEKERDIWEVELPPVKEFADDAGGTVALPGSMRVVKCPKCDGLGRIVCPGCQGRARVVAVREIKPGAARPRADAPPAGTPPAGAAPKSAAPAGAAGAATATATATATAQSAPVLVPCGECSGTGALPCDRCDTVGRLVQRQTTTWHRHARTVSSNDDLPRIDEQWLHRTCAAVEVYREQHKGGLRSDWPLVPALAELIGQTRADIGPDTRIALSEVSITMIPVTEIIFDLGDLPAPPAANGQGKAKGKAKPPAPDAGLYRWHIYGFENRLPNDWRFLDWSRVGVILLSLALLMVVGLLALLIARIG